VQLALARDVVVRVVGEVELDDVAAQAGRSWSERVRTTIPAATGVVQAAGVPARPSISTRQTRQEPKASRRVGGAELRDDDPGRRRRAQDRRSPPARDLAAVDGQRHRLAG
jgi:hypothetical protein